MVFGKKQDGKLLKWYLVIKIIRKYKNVLGIEVFVQTVPCAFHIRHSGNVQQREP